MSLGSGEGRKKGFFGFGRRGSTNKPDDGGINGQWGDDSEDDGDYFAEHHPSHAARPSGLRGGGTYEYSEFSDDDEAHFTTKPPQGTHTLANQPTKVTGDDDDGPDPLIRPFHRTPTGLSAKQMRKADQFAVNVEGGLDICLNVEVNPKDPAGITVPYRLLVPRLQYQYNPAHDDLQQAVKEQLQPTGFKRFLSFRKKPKTQGQQPDNGGEAYDNDDYLSDESSDNPGRQ
jgi:hypothetical protein